MPLGTQHLTARARTRDNVGPGDRRARISRLARTSAPVARASLAGVLAAGLVTLAAALPAAAHDSLVGSDPADGQTVTRAPERVELTFSGEIRPEFAQVAVVDSQGDTVIAGEPVVDGTKVRLTVPPMGNDEYRASFRVVSSDGHPISGQVRFNVDVPPSEKPTALEDAPDNNPAAVSGMAPDAVGAEASSEAPAESGPSAADGLAGNAAAASDDGVGGAGADEPSAVSTQTADTGFTTRAVVTIAVFSLVAAALIGGATLLTRREGSGRSSR